MPAVVDLVEGLMQGHKVGAQTILQFYTGTGRSYYLAMLDFEDWGSERCPRVAIYKFHSFEYTVVGEVNRYVLCADVDPMTHAINWPDDDTEN